uniref:Putative secreted protein n=1 Tax=Anopheles darlingi TaxID=43151 RepID=A0A2M4D7B8_ANODA
MSCTFFMRVTTSSWCATMLPDCRGVGVGGTSSESSFSVEVAFRFRLIFFCRAASSTAPPFTFTISGGCTGLGGRDRLRAGGSFFGVVTPVFCPVVIPSFRGNCTFRVSRYSSVTHSSNRLLKST